uniref:RxLR effector protein n=1 Tax=Ditylum brightwellii TaxID=49249 RepID=A0A7S4S2H9_9STRA
MNMKFTSLIVTALAAAFLTGSTHAGFPGEEDGRLNRYPARELSNGGTRYKDSKDNENNDTIDHIVKYTDDERHNIAKRYAENGKALDISRRRRTEVIKAKISDMDKLKNVPHIKAVELDSVRHAFPNLRGYDVAAGKGGRRLIDSTNPTPNTSSVSMSLLRQLFATVVV